MNELIRGTTPKLIFTVDDMLDLTTLTEIWFTISQSASNVEITHSLSEGKVSIDNDDKTITTRLSQEESLQFLSTKAEIQVRVLDTGGDSYSTDIYTVSFTRSLKEGVIGG